jgi:hypothetical protein
LGERVNWEAITRFLNRITESNSHIESAKFCFQENGNNIPLPEDYLLRGLTWSEGYFPPDWFSSSNPDEEEKLELESTSKARAERVLWLGIQIASVSL